MKNSHCRYFIELQPRDGVPVSRADEIETQRQSALKFVQTLREWLDENELNDRVSKLDATMFGQIQITCEPGVMQRIRDQDIVAIAAIRQNAGYTESLKLVERSAVV
jgi:hypothetical protein